MLSRWKYWPSMALGKFSRNPGILGGAQVLCIALNRCVDCRNLGVSVLGCFSSWRSLTGPTQNLQPATTCDQHSDWKQGLLFSPFLLAWTGPGMSGFILLTSRKKWDRRVIAKEMKLKHDFISTKNIQNNTEQILITLQTGVFFISVSLSTSARLPFQHPVTHHSCTTVNYRDENEDGTAVS